jgi:hypothetical protein
VIANVLVGNVWPDLLTGADLEGEGALREPLWPNHLAWPKDDEGRPVEPSPEEKPHRTGSRAPNPRKA